MQPDTTKPSTSPQVLNSLHFSAEKIISTPVFFWLSGAQATTTTKKLFKIQLSATMTMSFTKSFIFSTSHLNQVSLNPTMSNKPKMAFFLGFLMSFI